MPGSGLYFRPNCPLGNSLTPWTPLPEAPALSPPISWTPCSLLVASPTEDLHQALPPSPPPPGVPSPYVALLPTTSELLLLPHSFLLLAQEPWVPHKLYPSKSFLPPTTSPPAPSLPGPPEPDSPKHKITIYWLGIPPDRGRACEAQSGREERRVSLCLATNVHLTLPPASGYGASRGFLSTFKVQEELRGEMIALSRSQERR